MRRNLGILALAMAVSAPALAQNQSTMTYHLQLNGTPSTTLGARYDTTAALEQGPFMMPWGAWTLNWSVRLEVGGTIDGLLPGGAANVVFDLALKDSTGTLVGGGALDTDGGFGITTGPTGEAGFFSLIMNQTAGGPFAQQPAAFPWVFNTWYDPDQVGDDTNPAPPYGRLIDPVSANGPNMAQYIYPSTYKYFRQPGAATPITVGVSTPSGVLRGMGAGYTDFDFGLDGPERGGVGLTTDNGQQCYGCGVPNVPWCMDLQGRPIAEGQINMRGLPGGTYTLELIPGDGQNVLRPTIACSPYDGGTTGAFAAPANTVNGSSITFFYWVGDPPPPPIPVFNVASVKYHGGVAYGIPFIGDYCNNPGGATALSVECRTGGVTQIVLPFDVAVEAADGAIDGNEIALTGATLGTVTQTTPGVLLVNVTTTNQNGSCVKVTVSGLRRAGSGSWGMVMTPVTKSIVVLRGDVTGDGQVLSGDVSQIKVASGRSLTSTAVMFRRDLNCDGSVLSGDVTTVKTLTGNAAPACP